MVEHNFDGQREIEKQYNVKKRKSYSKRKYSFAEIRGLGFWKKMLVKSFQIFTDHAPSLRRLSLEWTGFVPYSISLLIYSRMQYISALHNYLKLDMYRADLLQDGSRSFTLDLL